MAQARKETKRAKESMDRQRRKAEEAATEAKEAAKKLEEIQAQIKRAQNELQYSKNDCASQQRALDEQIELTRKAEQDRAAMILSGGGWSLKDLQHVVQALCGGGGASSSKGETMAAPHHRRGRSKERGDKDRNRDDSRSNRGSPKDDPKRQHQGSSSREKPARMVDATPTLGRVAAPRMTVIGVEARVVMVPMARGLGMPAEEMEATEEAPAQDHRHRPAQAVPMDGHPSDPVTSRTRMGMTPQTTTASAPTSLSTYRGKKRRKSLQCWPPSQ